MIFLKIFEDFKKKRDFILLIGPPGVGKSHYIKQLKDDYVIINRDDIVTEIAERYNLTYKDAFIRPGFYKNIKNNGYYTSNNDEYYFKNDGKEYIKGKEIYGYLVDLDESDYEYKWTTKQFKIIHDINVKAVETIENKLQNAIIDPNVSIVIDMTNKTKNDRREFISKIRKNKKDFNIIAVVFNKGGYGIEDLIINVNRKRDIELKKLNKDKNIPDNIILAHIKKYEAPNKFEGFNEIIHINNIKELEKYVEY